MIDRMNARTDVLAGKNKRKMPSETFDEQSLPDKKIVTWPEKTNCPKKVVSGQIVNLVLIDFFGLSLHLAESQNRGPTDIPGHIS